MEIWIAFIGMITKAFTIKPQITCVGKGNSVSS